MFATGIENSIPRIKKGTARVDQMEVCGHYKHWKTDFDCVEDLGIRFLRYGPPLHTTFTAPSQYNWDFADEVFSDLQRRDMVPIVDLCHFGVPDWIGDFQNADFPGYFAEYARAFAERFPWVQLYTPVNEMFICATFSAKYGWWNEEGVTDRTFVTALKHIVKANVMAMTSILEVRPDAIFIQSESSEYFHAENPAAIRPAEILNSMRFLSLDLNYGHRVDLEMYEYLFANGMTYEEYHFFLGNSLKHHCILGNDYYWTNEHRVSADGADPRVGRNLRLQRNHTPVLRPLSPPGDAHRDQHHRRRQRRRGGELALERMGQRPERAQFRRADGGVHLVLADRPGRLGHGAA